MVTPSSVLHRPELVRELELYARGWCNVPSLYASEGGLVWGAFRRDALAGVIGVSRYLMRGGAELHLWGLYVQPGHRGSWVASVLMSTAMHWCHRQRLRAVTTQVHRSDHRALRWCRRKGFEAVEVPGQRQPELMHLRLQAKPGRCEEAGRIASPPERDPA